MLIHGSYMFYYTVFNFDLYMSAADIRYDTYCFVKK